MITFSLKQPGTRQPDKVKRKLQQSETLIYIHVNHGGRSVKMSTGMKIKPTDWNNVAHRARKGAFSSEAINRHLDKLEIRAKETVIGMIAEHGRVLPEDLRREMESVLPGIRGRETFVEFCKRYAAESKPNPATAKLYETTIRHLKKYSGSKDFSDINEAWLNRYVEYLNGKGLAKNTVGKNIRYIKLFLNAATDAGVNKNMAYKTRRFKNPAEETESIYLTEAELLRIYGHDQLPPYLDRARDLFIVGAFTGLRFSDFTKIRPEAITSGMITVKTQKTEQSIIIPVHWVVGQIIEKYAGHLPPPISNQKLNEYLKLIVARAGIKEKVIKYRTQGGVRTGETFEKWELVTTHTARRSFATNAYIAGLPTISIMKITGHRSERSFMKYIRISQQENAVAASAHPFFQPPGTW